MNGMDENMFNPMGEVTRAQMATLLYRVMGNFPVTIVRGSMVSYDNAKQEIKIQDTDNTSKVYTLTTKALVRLDGAAAAANTIAAGADVIINIEKSGTVRLVEALSPTAVETVSGIYSKYQNVTEGTQVYVRDPITSETKRYLMAGAVAIYKGSSGGRTIAELQDGDAVTLTLQGGKIIEIRAEDKKQTASGTVEDIQLLPEYKLTVKAGGTSTEYAVDSNVDVRKNGKTTSLADVVVGDSVSLTLTYGIITFADSHQQTANGGRQYCADCG